MSQIRCGNDRFKGMHHPALWTLAMVLLCAGSVTAQDRGQVVESLELESEWLGESVPYSIYFPPGYLESNRRYPVLYLLHGFSDDETGWVQFGRTAEIADHSYAANESVPMIIVMPDAGVSWYINNYDGTLRYEDFVVEELIPHVDETYRTRPEREFRAVGGLSMGGYGSLILALNNPTLFSSVGPMSAGVFTDEEIIAMPQQRWDYLLGTPFREGLEGEDRLTAHYREHSVLDRVREMPEAQLASLRFRIDCGDDDFLIRGNMALYEALLDREVDAEFRVREGAHSWSYWREGLPDLLSFVSESFGR
ncbi:MAG: alpha/beta hydrolase family protein [Balneolaceae bacterium]